MLVLLAQQHCDGIWLPVKGSKAEDGGACIRPSKREADLAAIYMCCDLQPCRRRCLLCIARQTIVWSRFLLPWVGKQRQLYSSSSCRRSHQQRHHRAELLVLCRFAVVAYVYDADDCLCSVRHQSAFHSQQHLLHLAWRSAGQYTYACIYGGIWLFSKSTQPVGVYDFVIRRGWGFVYAEGWGDMLWCVDLG